MTATNSWTLIEINNAIKYFPFISHIKHRKDMFSHVNAIKFFSLSNRSRPQKQNKNFGDLCKYQRRQLERINILMANDGH